jgi:NAD(P)-dependent dehydrogenase (short-subunit alcohol dehydrogenase family)
MSKVVLITGASSGFGRLTAEAIAKAGHIVYGSMRKTATRRAPVVEQMAAFSRENHVDLRALELDVQSQESVDLRMMIFMASNGRCNGLTSSRAARASRHVIGQVTSARPRSGSISRSR